MDKERIADSCQACGEPTECGMAKDEPTCWCFALPSVLPMPPEGTGKHHDRPVLIIRPFNAETFFGVALIGHPRTGRYYFPLGTIDDRDAVANLSQARLFDTKRLIRKIGMLDERTFRELAKALALTLFPFLPFK
jgi:mRNA-degrading endonuclease toxin of MazEF toxin-antitoxin module